MSTKEEKDWFKLKRYPHIGYPLNLSDRKWVTNYIKTKTALILLEGLMIHSFQGNLVIELGNSNIYYHRLYFHHF